MECQKGIAIFLKFVKIIIKVIIYINNANTLDYFFPKVFNNAINLYSCSIEQKIFYN